MSWLVYLLLCSDGSIYTGITNNLEKRLKAHNKGTASKYTKTRLPVELLTIIPCQNKSKALKLEYKIKQLSHKEKLEL